jgi:hypothetical protein
MVAGDGGDRSGAAMNVVAALTAGAAAFGSVYGAFAIFDSDQSESNRHFVRDWLLGIKVNEGDWQLFSKSFLQNFLAANTFRGSALGDRWCSAQEYMSF